MTNLLAAIVITVTTNWTTIGTFTPAGAGLASHDVQEGRRMTNTIAIVEHKHVKHEFVLESLPGPVIEERKVQRPTINWYVSPNQTFLNCTNVNTYPIDTKQLPSDP